MSKSRVRLKRRLISKRRELTPSDWRPLLHVVDRLTRGSSFEEGICAELPKFSHIVMDEAQFLQPDEINFFIGRTHRVKGTFTIVGDLNQKIDGRSGVFAWREVEVGATPVEVRQLNTVYRVTAEIYDFLEVFASVVDMESGFRRPREQNSEELPQVLRYGDEALYCSVISKWIWEIQGAEQGQSFCIIMKDPERCRGLVRKLERELSNYGIRLKVSYEEDCSESTEKVIITNYESIVGLEFDNIIVHADDMSADIQDSRNALWIALSRGRKRLVVSQSFDSPSIFDDSRFDRYRKALK